NADACTEKSNALHFSLHKSVARVPRDSRGTRYIPCCLLQVTVQTRNSFLSLKSTLVIRFLLRLKSPSKERLLSLYWPGMVQVIRPPYCPVVRLLVRVPARSWVRD